MVEKFLPPTLENKLLKPEGDLQFIGAQGACRLAQGYARKLATVSTPMLFSQNPVCRQDQVTEEAAAVVTTETHTLSSKMPTP